MYEKGGKAAEFAVAEATKRANVETTILDRYERQVELQQQLRAARVSLLIQMKIYDSTVNLRIILEMNRLVK